jgi:hypothetical protein
VLHFAFYGGIFFTLLKYSEFTYSLYCNNVVLVESIQENIEEEHSGEVLTDEDIAEAFIHS